jgi:hypothetical protein
VLACHMCSSPPRASSLPDDQPSVVVLDEMPYLIRTDPGFEGTLQKVFDRELSRKPVLLIGIGSDLAMLEALNEYGRPWQRSNAVVVILRCGGSRRRGVPGVAPPSSR